MTASLITLVTYVLVYEHSAIQRREPRLCSHFFELQIPFRATHEGRKRVLYP